MFKDVDFGKQYSASYLDVPLDVPKTLGGWINGSENEEFW